MKTELKAFEHIYRQGKSNDGKTFVIIPLAFFICFLFLPWTQNISSIGKVTSLYQEQRPQKINAPIAGKIVKWWIKEGDFVNQGDTIAQISEIKEEYLDPKLIERTKEQLEAKKSVNQYYSDKGKTMEAQIQNLQSGLKLKVEQLTNKLKQLKNKLDGEKAELRASENDYLLAKDQYERQQKLYAEGLVSQTQWQQRNVILQNSLAKKTVSENKINQTLQEISNTTLEQKSADQEYREKINKTEGDRLQVLGQVETGKGEIAKLKNQVVNYTIRNGMYFILAPQKGQIIQAKKAGLGEIIKDGDELVTIVPKKINYAVEMFVRPVDLPLVSKGQPVRFIFDGYPAIIFSGWPNQSYGTYGGKIVAFENSISSNGLFRVLVGEDPNDRKWPEQIKIGAGAKGIALLKDVPIWYELWRNMNGFPPDFYQFKVETSAKNEK